MKVVLISVVILLGGALFLGPLAGSIGAPDSVVRILDQVGSIF